MTSPRRPSATNSSDDRSLLRHDVEFQRFLTERQADEQREADRLQHEIDTLLEQVDCKRREQAERLNVIDACMAGLGINDKTNRPAPTLTQRPPEAPVVSTAEAAAILEADQK